jgi:hypothetical protein
LNPAGGITIYGWSADGKRIVYYDGAPTRFSVFDLKTRQTWEPISHPAYSQGPLLQSEAGNTADEKVEIDADDGRRDRARKRSCRRQSPTRF